MNKKYCCLIISLLIAPCLPLKAQLVEIAKAKPADRLPLFWEYCTNQLISDKDSVNVHRFFDDVGRIADSTGDRQLHRYVEFISQCYQVPFSENFEKHFPAGGYKDAIALLTKTQTWALKQDYADIAATCEAFIGQIYYTANRYGQAFEHLLKADQAFNAVGYAQAPNIAEFLYVLGLRFYQFGEYDKALEKLLKATAFRFYVPRMEINTLNAIGLIYARKNQPDSAISFFRTTINKAVQTNDRAWIGIGSGNLGNVYLSLNQYDSALLYHKRNFSINSDIAMRAPEDAAKSAVSMAAAYIAKNQLDSALFFINAGKPLAQAWIKDSTEKLDFEARMLRVMVKYFSATNDLKAALDMTDSLAVTERKLRSVNDSKILSRAVEKTEALSFATNLALVKSEKNASQFRLYFIIAVLFTGLLLLAFIYRDRLLRNKRMMQMAEKDHQILVAEKLLAEEGLKHSRDLLNAYVDTIKEKSILISQLENELNETRKNISHDQAGGTVFSRDQLLGGTILTDMEWQQFRELFEKVYPGFTFRMKTAYPELSPAESRFLYLAKLNLNSREMATMLGITIEAIHKLRYRLRKKLNLEEASGFEAVIQNIS